jgi:hypothetical protein
MLALGGVTTADTVTGSHFQAALEGHLKFVIIYELCVTADGAQRDSHEIYLHARVAGVCRSSSFCGMLDKRSAWPDVDGNTNKLYKVGERSISHPPVCLRSRHWKISNYGSRDIR